MDTKKADALRAPFPEAAIGKLPKGGVQLDYVGHAATTDRLLKVDPTWTWEPLATDEAGLAAMDAAGNLWIRLTVCGVTRIGVGDGKTAKERIGDAIRNAAMRFGVALDLWAKEDLHANGDQAAASLAERQKQLIQQRQLSTPPPEEEIPFGPEDESASTAMATRAQQAKLNLLVGRLREAGHISTEQLYKALASSRGIDWQSLSDDIRGKDKEGELHWAHLRESLTKTEASNLIDRLEKLEAQTGGTE